VLKRDENYSEDYLYRAGHPINSRFGYEVDMSNPFYTASDFEADGTTLKEGFATTTFGTVQPGDLKYKNQNPNSDDVINSDDQVIIGKTNNPLDYSLNVQVSYSGFSLFLLGTGQTGGDALMNGSYYQMDAGDKYSAIARDTWTEATATTAKYPRMTTGQEQNNFKTSNFWQYDNSFFKLSRAQLTYEFDQKICEKLKMQNLSVNVMGSNMFEISKNKEQRQLEMGIQQLRTFTLGLRTSF
jgi:hypothetical protein